MSPGLSIPTFTPDPTLGHPPDNLVRGSTRVSRVTTTRVGPVRVLSPVATALSSSQICPVGVRDRIRRRSTPTRWPLYIPRTTGVEFTLDCLSPLTPSPS